MKINEFGEIELSDEERQEICNEIRKRGYIPYVGRFGAVYINGRLYGFVKAPCLSHINNQ